MIQAVNQLVNLVKGELVKLTFISFPDNTFSESSKDTTLGLPKSYAVMINPSSIKRNFSIVYDDSKSAGQRVSLQPFLFNNPETWSFDFVIDGTGIATGEKGSDWSVAIEINHFLSVVYSFAPDTNRPPFVAVLYAGHLFKGVLNSLDISYDMFHPNGLPLRAKISCTFSSAANAEKDASKTSVTSPDMTHRRVLKEDETLVSKAYDIYESNDYYVSVARANDLNNFRKIKHGIELYFPPLKNK